MVDCSKKCLLCNDDQHFKVNYSEFHGCCSTHKDISSSAECIHCGIYIQILIKKPIQNQKCDKCFKKTLNTEKYCEHLYCDECLLQNDYYCQLCTAVSINTYRAKKCSECNERPLYLLKTCKEHGLCKQCSKKKPHKCDCMQCSKCGGGNAFEEFQCGHKLCAICISEISVHLGNLEKCYVCLEKQFNISVITRCPKCKREDCSRTKEENFIACNSCNHIFCEYCFQSAPWFFSHNCKHKFTNIITGYVCPKCEFDRFANENKTFLKCMSCSFVFCRLCNGKKERNHVCKKIPLSEEEKMNSVNELEIINQELIDLQKMMIMCQECNTTTIVDLTKGKWNCENRKCKKPLDLP